MASRVAAWVRRLACRLRNALSPGGAERDLDRELAAHAALIADDLARRGVPPADAATAARRKLGRVDRIKEDYREARSFRLLDDARQDATYAVRMMRRSPAVSAVVIGSLAIGIGANTVAFSLRDSLVRRPLPVPRPTELVNVRELWPGSCPRSEAPTWEFNGLRDGGAPVATISAIAMFDRSNVSLTARDGQRVDSGRLRIAIVSGNYFPMLEVSAAIGRVLTPDDDRVPGGHPVAVLSADYWQRSRRGESADAIGTTVTINRTAFTIVGVMPEGFTGDWVGRPVDVWVPALMQGAVMIEAPTALTKPNDYWLRLVARLGPGITRAAAEAAMQPAYQQVMRNAVSAGVLSQGIESIAQQRIELLSGAHGYSPERDAIARFTRTMAGVAALLLLTVAANVAGILLARSVSRQRELALRLAIGAGRLRLARQLLVEGLLLAGLGGVLGVCMAVWSTRLLATALATAPVQMFWAASTWRSFEVALSWRGLLMTAALSVTAGTICGLAPLMRARQVALAPALSVRGDGGAASRLLVSRLLVIAQIALALVIVAAASLLARSLGSLREQPLGFDRENLVLVWTQPSSTGKRGQALRDLWGDATARIASLPGVASAGSWNSQLLNGGIATPGREMQHIHADGQPARSSPLPYGRTFVTPGIFKALGVPLLAGREFTDRDTETSPAVGIINETMARVYFDRENPVGRHVRFGSPAAPLVEIVGVVRDFEGGTPRGIGHGRMQTFFPYRASDGGQLVVMCVAIRTQGDPARIMARVREALQRVDPSLAVLAVNTIDQQLDDLLAQDRLLAGLVAIFGAVSALLACLGLYGLVAHITARRTTEIGVRMALGATSRAVLAMIVRDGARLAIWGVLGGVAASLAVGRLIAWQLFQVRPHDPLTIATAAAVMIAVALTAAWLPARRAARMNPIVALREG